MHFSFQLNLIRVSLNSIHKFKMIQFLFNARVSVLHFKEKSIKT